MACETPRIVVAEAFDETAMNRLRAAGEVIVIDCREESALNAAVQDCDALLVRSRSRVTRSMLAGAKRLRVIGRAGVGLENIDLEAAREQGITVVYTPGAATDAAADMTLGLMLCLIRSIALGDRLVRENRFEEARGALVGRELNSLCVGIVGMGRIGSAVARRCRQGFQMRVLYNDIAAVGPFDFPVEAMSKSDLYAQSDFVSLHVPLTPQTRGMIDAATLSGFKKGAYLINTARGGVWNTVAVAKALEDGRLGGAATDVFDPEPPNPNDPLLSAPHVLLSPHIGARTHEGLSRMNEVIDDVLRVLQGQPPRWPA